MKIVNNEPYSCEFGKLKCGDVFKDKHEAGYLMKTEMCYDDDGDPINYIYLGDGLFGGMYADETIVVKVDCELVIKG